MEESGKDMRYPLGGSLYAYVKTRKKCVSVHLRHFTEPKHTKGGKLVPSVKGLKMDLKTLNRLFRVKKQLTEEYQRQLNAVLNDCHGVLKRKKKVFHPVQQVRTDQTDTYPGCCLDIGALTPSYSSKQNTTDTVITYPDNCVNEDTQFLLENTQV